MSPSIRRVRGGLVAKRYGEMFENMFAANCARLGVTATRFPDGCKQIGARRLIRVQTPFDWILTCNGITAFIDTKTVNSDKFAHSAISDHQVFEMQRHASEGAIAGYCIWLRKNDSIAFIASQTLNGAISKRGSFSILSPEVRLLGLSFSWDIRKIFPLQKD